MNKVKQHAGKAIAGQAGDLFQTGPILVFQHYASSMVVDDTFDHTGCYDDRESERIVLDDKRDLFAHGRGARRGHSNDGRRRRTLDKALGDWPRFILRELGGFAELTQYRRSGDAGLRIKLDEPVD